MQQTLNTNEIYQEVKENMDDMTPCCQRNLCDSTIFPPEGALGSLKFFL